MNGKNNIMLPRSTPGTEGIDAKTVMRFIDTAKSEGYELHSIMMVKNGKVAVEGYWSPYASYIRHGMYSVTKTFTATAVGFAISEGLLSLSDRLIDFFPDKAPKNPCEHLKALTIRDLLVMGCGQEEEVDIAKSQDAVKTFMSAPFPVKPGTEFKYNSIASHMLAEVIFHLTGKSLPEYLKPRLFEPLGISNVRWDKTPQGLEMGGWGIHLTTEDLAKMGLLFLQGGKWGGKQIVPETWIREASKRQIDNSPGAPAPDWSAGYCYQMWRNATPGSFRLDGAYGQLSLIYPDKNAVIVITGANTKMVGLFALIGEVLVPSLKDKPLLQIEADADLSKILCELSIDEIKPAERSPLEAEISGKTITFDENDDSLIPFSQRKMAFMTESGIQSARLIFAHKICLFSWREASQERTVKIGLEGRYADSQMELACALNPIKAQGAFCGGTFSFVMRAIEEPHAMHIEMEFSGGTVRLSYYDALESESGIVRHTISGHF